VKLSEDDNTVVQRSTAASSVSDDEKLTQTVRKMRGLEAAQQLLSIRQSWNRSRRLKKPDMCCSTSVGRRFISKSSQHETMTHLPALIPARPDAGSDEDKQRDFDWFDQSGSLGLFRCRVEDQNSVSSPPRISPDRDRRARACVQLPSNALWTVRSACSSLSC